MDCLEEALRQARDLQQRPQGVQFTSEAFTGVLLREGIAISMEGRSCEDAAIRQLCRAAPGTTNPGGPVNRATQLPIGRVRVEAVGPGNARLFQHMAVDRSQDLFTTVTSLDRTAGDVQRVKREFTIVND